MSGSSTLAMVAKMQPHGPTMSRIAREMALDVAAAMYSPDVIAHLPGIANKAADALSRRFQHEKLAELPHYLHPELEVHIKIRTGKWWKAGPA